MGYVSYTSTQLNQENYELKKKSSGQTIMIGKLNDANMKLEGKNSNLEKELEKKQSDRDKDAKEIKDLNDRLYNSNQEVEKLRLEVEKSKRDKVVKVSSRGGSNSSISTTSSHKDSNPKQVTQKEQSKSQAKEQPKQQTSNNSEPSGNWITMNASAYSTDGNDPYVSAKWGGKTASGNYPKQGRDVAVSNSQFKRGTRLELKFPSGYEHLNGSNYLATDTGNWITHGKIDIFMNSTASCNAFGRRQIQARVVN